MITITQLRAAIKLLKLRIDSDSIHITEVTNPSYEFLTSDRPVTVMDPDGNKHIIPINPANFMTLPIDKKHLLSLLPGCAPYNKYTIFREHSDGYMRTLTHNIQQVSRADNFLLGSAKGLQSFLKSIPILNSTHNSV